MKTQRILTCVKVGLAAAAILGLSIMATPTAIAQPQSRAPQVVVTPADDLPPTASVWVEMSGFDPEAAVFIQQCAEVSPNVWGCDYDHTTSLSLDAEGAGATEVIVRRVFEAHGLDGDLLAAVDCVSVELGCSLAAGNFGEAADAKISFRDDDGCRAPGAAPARLDLEVSTGIGLSLGHRRAGGER